jgi:serine/threonine protein kinase
MDSIHCPDQALELRDYEVLDKINEGSMAVIYKARRRQGGGLFALKVPKPGVTDDKVLRERFRQEFRAGSSLNHPNIVRALEFIHEGDTVCLVMEYVDGQDLWDLIRQQGRLSEEEAVRVIVHAARGLHEAHRHGIIHRDVKPDNIMLTSDGQVKLGDLGLIKELEAQLNLTCAQKGLGTPNFIAPEQFTEARDADIRCDVYSLGATLYMAVTGEMPFHAKSVSDILRKKLNNQLRPPREIVPELSEQVDFTIRRAVQVDPNRRHASCLEFIQALTGGGNPEAPTAGGVGPRLQRTGSREDRRRAARYPCTLATICEIRTSIHSGEDAALDQWSGKVLNLSATGVGLLLDRRFESGTLLAALLESHDHSFQFQAKIQVIRSIRADDNKWYTGACFIPALGARSLRKLL